VKAVLQNKRVFLSVDQDLLLLEDECTNDFKSLTFGSDIDCFAVSKSGDLILVCLADGNIHGVYCKGLPVFNL
jgi:kinetochore-associated protein 1